MSCLLFVVQLSMLFAFVIFCRVCPAPRLASRGMTCANRGGRAPCAPEGETGRAVAASVWWQIHATRLLPRMRGDTLSERSGAGAAAGGGVDYRERT